MASLYDVGDLVRITVTFTNLSGTPTNPTSTALTVQDPTGAQTTPSLTSDGSGVYHYDLTITSAGRWLYRITGTGAIVAAVEGDLLVQSRLVA